MLFARELSHSTRTSIECGPPYETVGAFCPHFICYDKMKYLDSHYFNFQGGPFLSSQNNHTLNIINSLSSLLSLVSDVEEAE